MTIQKAIRTGKKFRRSGWGFNLQIRKSDGLPIIRDFHNARIRRRIYLRAEDILATDWVVKEPKNDLR